MRCAACGSEGLLEGEIKGGDGTMPNFFLTDTPLLTRIFGFGARAITAYACIRCQHLQLTVDFRDDDRERYAEFEGEQPTVLERINAAPEKSDEN